MSPDDHWSLLSAALLSAKTNSTIEEVAESQSNLNVDVFLSFSGRLLLSSSSEQPSLPTAREPSFAGKNVHADRLAAACLGHNSSS